MREARTKRRPRSVAGKIGAFLLGLVITILALEAALTVAGWLFLADQRRTNERESGDADYTVLCLGESSTALGGEYSYPRQLEDLLNEHGGGRRFKVINVGLPGIDSHLIVEKLGENLAEFEPDVVTVMMGINDGLKTFNNLGRSGEVSGGVRFLRHFKTYRLYRFLLLSAKR